MKTATITWICYRNFGTFLQAYSLQRVVKQLGHENWIIYDRHFAKHKKDSNSIKGHLIEIYGMLSSIVKQPYCFKMNRCYDRFLKDKLQIDYNVQTLNGLSEKYDAFICGSDQIWSPYIEFEPYYFLGFPAQRKIAYAPSVGTGKCTEEYVRNAIPLIRQFDYLSTREDIGSEMLKKYINKPIVTVLDPTLLLDGNEWSKLTSEIEDENILLCYYLTANDWYIEYAKQYVKEHNLKLYIFGTNPTYSKFADRVIYGGPLEFLSYIKSAKVIFTDSFHATIFSILFHKKFQTFKRFQDGKGADQNARLYNLFSQLHIENHFIGEDDPFNPDMNASANWSDVEFNLKKLRRESIEYLKNSLADKN